MIIGSKIYQTSTTKNSMEWAKQYVQEAPDGAIFLVDILTHARGRHGRQWQFMPGQLCVTLLLKPTNLTSIKPEDLPVRLNQLNMALTLGIQEPLKTIGVSLKWPNDFVACNKKVGGLIMELIWHGNQPDAIIVGFALNGNNEFEPNHELYPTAISLKTVCNKELDLAQLQQQILVSMDEWYNKWLDGSYNKIFQAWKDEQVYLGKPLTIHRQDGTTATGIMKKAIENGDLILERENNIEETISLYQVEEVKI